MKIVIHGPLAGPWWDGSPALHSWGPDETVEVDDKNAKAVAWAQGWAATPHATLVEDVKTAKAAVTGSAQASAKSGSR